MNYALNYSPEEREKLQDENDRLIADIIDRLSDEGVSLLTEEEITQFKSGDLSEEQVLEIIGERKIANDKIETNRRQFRCGIRLEKSISKRKEHKKGIYFV